MAEVKSKQAWDVAEVQHATSEASTTANHDPLEGGTTPENSEPAILNAADNSHSTWQSVPDTGQAAHLASLQETDECPGANKSNDYPQFSTSSSSEEPTKNNSPPADVTLFRLHPFQKKSVSHKTCLADSQDELEVAEPDLQASGDPNQRLNESGNVCELADIPDDMFVTDCCYGLYPEEQQLEEGLRAIDLLNEEVESINSSLAVLDANMAHCQLESFLLDDFEMQTTAYGDGERYIMYPELNNEPEVDRTGDDKRTLLEQYIVEFVETRNHILRENRSRWSKEIEGNQDLDDYSPIDMIPDEVLLKILSYIPLKDNMTVIAIVCKRWYILAADPSLWQHINIPSESLIEPHWLGFLASKAPQLKSISIRGGRNISKDALSVIAPYCPLLNVVDFGFCNITVPMLDTLAENCHHIHTANFEGCECVNSSWMEALCKMQKLKNINISHCNHLSDDDVVFMAEHLTSLVDVSIDGNSFLSDKCVLALCKKHRETLVKLSIDGAESTDLSLESSLSCPNLTLFTISFADNLTNRSIDHLLNGQKLTHLQVRKNKIIDTNSLQRLFLSSSMKHLVHLDLTECLHVTDLVVEAICKCCPELVALILQWCWLITDVGVEHIVNTFSNLQHLDLLGLDTIQGTSFDKLPLHLPKLVFLNLAQCNKIDDDLLVRVLERMPQLTAINFYHENFRNAT